MKIKELRLVLKNIGTEHDECEVLGPAFDHSYEPLDSGGLIEIGMQKEKYNSYRLSEWYGDPKDFGYKTMKTFKAAGHKVAMALVIE